MNPSQESTANRGDASRMRPVQGVSFPRSGHAAVYHILRAYFQDAFVYCDPDNKKHCGCRSVPCTNPRRTFAKNHDFGLRNLLVTRRFRTFGPLHVPSGLKGVPVNKQERYLIQYRTPVPAIVSDYKVFVGKTNNNMNSKSWRRFAIKEMAYWNRFVDKWVLGFPATAKTPVFCSYEQLLADPEGQVRKILEYASRGPVDERDLQSALCRHPVEPRRSLQNFTFSDDGFFLELESMAGPRMARLGLPSFAD